ncbi:hypothetical protein [Streptococcus sp. DD13]|uniref:hypothetical protein n=1 Tax=Streptococcus sp. DD13 TaxID=1777881 RepID=UPI0012E8908F|nr:hypothetical protein [Streptococcus sp. DD13]
MYGLAALGLAVYLSSHKNLSAFFLSQILVCLYTIFLAPRQVIYSNSRLKNMDFLLSDVFTPVEKSQNKRILARYYTLFAGVVMVVWESLVVLTFFSRSWWTFPVVSLITAVSVLTVYWGTLRQIHLHQLSIQEAVSPFGKQVVGAVSLLVFVKWLGSVLKSGNWVAVFSEGNLFALLLMLLAILFFRLAILFRSDQVRLQRTGRPDRHKGGGLDRDYIEEYIKRGPIYVFFLLPACLSYTPLSEWGVFLVLAAFLNLIYTPNFCSYPILHYLKAVRIAPLRLLGPYVAKVALYQFLLGLIMAGIAGFQGLIFWIFFLNLLFLLIGKGLLAVFVLKSRILDIYKTDVYLSFSFFLPLLNIVLAFYVH